MASSMPRCSCRCSRCLASPTLAALSEDSKCDNVLLEYHLALEMKQRKRIISIFPILLGEVTERRSVEEAAIYQRRVWIETVSSPILVCDGHA